jgi:CO/xanthine dehydrogenase Mo-binding subunit
MSLPGAIERTPQLDRWLRFSSAGRLVIRTGKVELGQGIKTALAMIVAEELDVPLARILVETADTELTPNEFITAGSMSVEDSGSALRVAAAAARRALLDMAAAALDVSVESLQVEAGLVSSRDSNEQTDYWTLLNGSGFELDIVELPELKDPHAYHTVGTHAPRLDLPAKVSGEAAFVHDMVLPQMRYGRVVKPPQQQAELIACPDALPADQFGGEVELIRDGSFIGVVARREETAIRAAERLASLCQWRSEPLQPAMAGIPAYLRSNVTRSFPVVDGVPVEQPVAAWQVPEAAVKTLAASYYRPYQMHGSLGPSAAVAQFADGKLTVYSHSQGVELLKVALAEALELPADRVHVIHAEGAGAYGHNGADDVALDAALLAMAVEPYPVRLLWSRADEHGFEPYAPAALMDLRASLDAAGRIVAWRHETCGFTHMGRPRPHPGHSNLQSAWWRAKPTPRVPVQPLMMAEAGIHRNLQPIYDFPEPQLVKHFVQQSPLRTSSLRGLGAFGNVFAIESFMDELAAAAGREPIEFRLAHLQNPRARAVLELLRAHAPEQPSASNAGRGVALAQYKNRQAYCAVMVDVAVADDGAVKLLQALITADAGLAVDPDGLINQLEGGFIQAASWALKEQVRWDHDGVTSRDWDSYPILRFSEVPSIETRLVQRKLERTLGAGEASTGPTPAAIGNAIFQASGVRVRDIPFTPENVRAAAAS